MTYQMDYSSADMICVLKVNTQCEACKMKVIQILQRIRGVYNIIFDGEEGTVKVTGRVNPCALLNVLEKYVKHAKVKYMKFDGEVLERSHMYCGECGYASYDGMEHYCSSYSQMPYPQNQWHHDQHYSQPPSRPPPPYPFVPLSPSAPFPPHPSHHNHNFGPHPLPTYCTPYPPPPPPIAKSRQSKQNQCAIM